MGGFLDAHLPVAFAHRGGAAERPENTMAAFAHAVDLGYQYIETDVQATADGVCVLLHDPPPANVRGLSGPIASMRWSDVAGATVAGQPVPRAEELFGAWPQLRINLDLKTDAAVAPLARLLRSGDHVSRVCVGSFSDRRLAQMRRLSGSDIVTSMGPKQVALLRATASRLLPLAAVARTARCAQVPVRHRRITIVDEAFVRTAHRLGLQVHVWTVNDPAEMRQLLDIGVDGLMTDEISTLRGVLRSRGQWS